jgi:general secretion pathway protein N
MIGAWWMLGGTAALLAGTIALEAMPAPRAVPAARPVAVAAAVPAASPASAPPDRGLVQTILARPLFAPDRRPDAETGAARAGLPRLAGIVFVPGDAVGIFQADEKAKPVSVAEGGFIGGCGVVRVERDRVTITCNGATHVMRPSYLNAVAAAPVPISRLLHAKRTDPALQP